MARSEEEVFLRGNWKTIVLSRCDEIHIFVVTFYCSGCKFPLPNSSQYELTIEAKFDGQLMKTDPVEHVENPNFTQELAWPVNSKALHQHRLQRSAVKVIIRSSDATAEQAVREEIGYVVLNLRLAQHDKVSLTECFS